MSSSIALELARVLVVDDDPAARLTLQTVLSAGGYNVDAAASAAEAVSLLEEGVYELVLSNLQLESPEAGRKVIGHARNMDYKPATAFIEAFHEQTVQEVPFPAKHSLLIEPEDVPGLLTQVAGLIGARATRRLERELRLSHT